MFRCIENRVITIHNTKSKIGGCSKQKIKNTMFTQSLEENEITGWMNEHLRKKNFYFKNPKLEPIEYWIWNKDKLHSKNGCITYMLGTHFMQ